MTLQYAGVKVIFNFKLVKPILIGQKNGETP